MQAKVERELKAIAKTSDISKRQLDEIAINPTSQLEKRTTRKEARGCGVRIAANPYPQRNEMAQNSLAYGYSIPGVCLNFAFVSAPAFRRVGPDYDVEHVLEWSTVTAFFDWLNTKPYRAYRYPNPIPGSTDAIDICEFWQRVWFHGPAIPVNGRSLTPVQHIAANYPSATAFTKEFVFLQSVINQVPKQKMWAAKNTSGIFDVKRLDSKIQGQRTTIRRAREAMLWLKALLGAHS